jgi:ParB family transcriptional regulator, chromosome partitioning protein
MPKIISISPFRCRVSRQHPRLDEHITEESCEAELKSFEAHGQLVPALGRRLREKGDHDVEILCGARRLFVATYFNLPLLVELRQMSDRDALVAMDLDNRQRADVSPYERGLSYARWLAEGCFASQGDLAAALQISPSQVSRLLRLATLPTEVVTAFGGPAGVCEAWGVALAVVLDDASTRRAVVQRSQEIAAEASRRPAREIQNELYALAETRKERGAVDRRVIKTADGTPLFEIKRQSDSILVFLPLPNLSAKALKAIEESLSRILQAGRNNEAGAQPQRLTFVNAAPRPSNARLALSRIAS